MSYINTNKAAQDLQEVFKCLICHTIPQEPYFTGVCDHLLCKKCISKSNLCPICGISFYQKECKINKMIKEAILYINTIVELTKDDNEAEAQTSAKAVALDLDSSLPDIDLDATSAVEEKENQNVNNKKKEKEPSNNKSDFLVPILPDILETQTATTRKSRRSAPTQSTSSIPASTQRQRKNSKKQVDDEDVIKIDTQSQTATQKSRAQSNKRSRKNNKGETPLHLAVMNNDVAKITELLTEPTTDVNAKDNAGWTPLHESCNQGCFEIVKLLVEHNADVNAPGYQNNTPLHEATLNKQFECVKYLLENGANQQLRNQYGVLAKDFVRSLPDYKQLFDSFANQSKPAQNDDLNQSVVSTFDLDASFNSMASNKRSRSKQAKKVVFGTGMTEGDKLKLAILASKLNLTVAKEMNNTVTHVIYSNNDGNVCTRTINYMKAILMGIWVVSIKWLEACVAKCGFVEENPYEATGSIKMSNSSGPFKGRMNAGCQYPKLFEDCNFYFYGEFTVFDREDMIKLVQLAGGTILKREPKLDRIDELISKNKDPPHHLDTDFNCYNFILTLNEMNRTLATTISGCDIDDDDLELDLDQLREIENLSQAKSNKNNKTISLDTSSDDNLFKKPFEVDKTDNDDKLEIGLSQISSNIFEKSSLNDLFDNHDEDEEDEFIKSQPMFSSTQMATNKSDEQAEFKIPLPPQPAKYQTSNLNSSVIVSAYSIDDDSAKKKERELSPRICETSEHSLDLNKSTIWTYATTNLVEEFKNLGFNERFLFRHTIGYYLKKFFEYDLLVKVPENIFRKLPILCVWVKEATRDRNGNNATLLLTDGNQQIKGTLSSDITKDYWQCFVTGTVILLQDVPLIRINMNKNGYHLNLKMDSIIKIFYANLEEADKVITVSLKRIDDEKIKTSINEFEKKYIFYENVDINDLDPQETSQSSKSSANNSKAKQTASNTSTNNQSSNKSAPYQVPNHLKNSNNQVQNRNQAQAKNTTSTFQNNQTAAPKQSSTAPRQPFQFNKTNTPAPPPAPTNTMSKPTTGSTNTTNNTSSTSNNRPFQFKNPNTLNIQPPSLSQTNSQQAMNRNNLTLSENELSQLIFGIEDEILKDD